MHPPLLDPLGRLTRPSIECSIVAGSACLQRRGEFVGWSSGEDINQNLRLHGWRSDDPPGTTYFWGGLEQKILRTLNEAGITVVVTGYAPPPISDTQAYMSSPHVPTDVELIHCIRQRGRLQVVCGSWNTRVEPALLIDQICRMNPRWWVAVLTPGRTTANELARGLARLGHHPVTHPDIIGISERRRPRLTVAWSDAVGLNVPLLRLVDVLVVTDAPTKFNLVIENAVLLAQRARLVALVDHGTRLAHRDRYRIAEIFGPDPLYIPAHGRRRRNVRAAFVQFTGRAGRRSGDDVVTMKRALVWRHPVRNRLVKKIANALADGDRAVLLRVLPPGATDGVRIPARTAVLVENREHGERLARVFRNWSLVHDHGIGFNACTRVIATMAGLRTLGRVRFDAIVRADSTCGLPSTLAPSSLIAGNDATNLLIVDFYDRHHPKLRANARVRRERYVEAGWASANLKTCDESAGDDQASGGDEGGGES